MNLRSGRSNDGFNAATGAGCLGDQRPKRPKRQNDSCFQKSCADGNKARPHVNAKEPAGDTEELFNPAARTARENVGAIE
jgi:hypothetical protein